MIAAIQLRIATLASPLVQQWRRMDDGAQRVIAVAAILLLCALILAYVWLPAIRTHTQLLARLPVLESQLAKTQRDAAEVRAVLAKPAVGETQGIADSAALQGVFGEVAKVTAESGRGFRVVIPRVAYAIWWDQVGEAQSRYAMEIGSLVLKPIEIDAQARQLVSVEFTLLVTRASPARPSRP